MAMNTQVEDDDYKTMMGQIQDVFIEMEREIDIPQHVSQRFGLWDQLREWCENLALEYNNVQEKRDEWKNDYEELKRKYDALQQTIQEVSDDLYTLPDMDTDEENDGQILLSNNVIDSVNNGIADAAQKLADMADESWVPIKKPATKKRKK